ncbi:MAG: DUF3794 domain-containing protein [Cellulosilyticaceae bacterium]
MSVILTGKVFNDLSHKGIYSDLYPGIPYVLIALRCPDHTLLTTQTDQSGTYIFDLNLSGDYILLELIDSHDENTIPEVFHQPLGVNGSTTVRKHCFSITSSQLSEKAELPPAYFGHDLSEPFSSTELVYMLNANISSLEALNLITGQTHLVTSIHFNDFFKLLCFNPLDQFIYGTVLHKGEILRLSADGLVATYPIKYLPDKSFIVGDIDHEGRLYLYEPLDTTFYVVDINPYSATYMHLLDPNNHLSEATSSVGYPIIPLDISTCCFNPLDNLFYTVDAKGYLMSINFPSNEIKYLTTTGTPPFSVSMMICDCKGYLYCLFEGISSLYRITLSGTKAFSEIFSSLSINYLPSGVKCYDSPTYIQQGSAPDISSLNGPGDYNTTLSHNGPRHGMTNILFFGKEDLSYLEPTCLFITDTSYQMTLPITNHTDQDAYLYGWIDFNRNGIFEPSESIEALLIPSTTAKSVDFSITFSMPDETNVLLGDSYIRLRLTTDVLSLSESSKNLEDSRALGPASDGQVLDLPLTIKALAPTSTDSIHSFCEINQSIKGMVSMEDPCNGTLHYKMETLPHYGSAHIHPHTGAWDYKPHENFVGEDTFILSAASSRSQLSTTLPVFISIQKAELKIATLTNHSEFLVGDTVTYTTTIENTGTVPITSIIYTHPLDAGISFILSSVHINSIRDYSATPEYGISINNLSPGEICILTFQALLTTPPKICTNKGTITGSYHIASLQAPYTQEGNLTNLIIKSPNLSLNLKSNLADAFLDDTVQYTLKLTNSGDLPLQSVKLMAALPPELVYDNHLTLNHSPVTADLCAGYTIQDLNPDETVILQFTAHVLHSSSNNTIHTTLFASYAYKLNEETKISKDLSTQCALNICIPDIKLTSQFNKQAILLGEPFHYILTVTNHSEFLIEDTILKSILPYDVQVLDIFYNNKPIPNALDTGLSLGKLAPLNMIEVTATLKLINIPSNKELILPSPTGIFTLSPLKSAPNKVIYVESTAPSPLPITDATLHLHKVASTPEAAIGEVITYTITLTNGGTIALNQVTIRDLLCPELKFIVDSIVLNGKPLPQTSLMSGIVIDNLLPDQSQTIAFDCLILAKGNGVLKNSCSAYYTYKPHHCSYIKSDSTTSNICSIIIHQAYLNVSGTVSQTMAFLDDELTYTLEVINTGDVDAFNVFLDTHLDGCELIDGTFMINNLVVHSINLLGPINIGIIPKGQTTYIHYNVKVIGHCHFEDTLVHTSSVSFAYTTTDHCIKYDSSSEIDLTIPLALSTFKQLSLDNFLEVPCHEPDIETINTISGQVSILKNYMIDTPKGVSLEGHKLSSKKLIIHALLELNVEYVAGIPNQPVHSMYYTIPFSSFIVLPKDCQTHALTHINATIENISFKVLNNRVFFTNSSILLIARIK